MYHFPMIVGGVFVFMVLYWCLIGIYQVGILLFKFGAALDNNFAPKLQLNNIFYQFLCFISIKDDNLSHKVILGKERYYIHKMNYEDHIYKRYDIGDKYSYFNSKAIDRDPKYFVEKCCYDSADEAKKSEFYEKETSVGFSHAFALIVGFIADILCLLYKYAPMITSIFVAIILFLCITRFIANHLYNGLHKHQVDIDDHENRITTLEKK